MKYVIVCGSKHDGYFSHFDKWHSYFSTEKEEIKFFKFKFFAKVACLLLMKKLEYGRSDFSIYKYCEKCGMRVDIRHKL